jgi:hypothetical protein
MSDATLFDTDPRGYALRMVDDGEIDPRMMLVTALNWLHTHEVRDMLVANALNPQYDQEEQQA